jgi:CheY-like chemotaxis protein
VRQLLATFLSRGASVSLAADGAAAIAALESSATFHAVVSDFTMPGANGVEVLRHARRVHPDAKLFLMSGALTDDIRKAGAGLGAVVFEKPFQPGTLARLAEMCGCVASPVA